MYFNTPFQMFRLNNFFHYVEMRQICQLNVAKAYWFPGGTMAQAHNPLVPGLKNDQQQTTTPKFHSIDLMKNLIADAFFVVFL